MPATTYIEATVVQEQTLVLDQNYAALMRCKVFIAGNGVEPYFFMSGSFVQGAHSVAVKANGATSFYVPPFGRWSDYSSLTGFTVPGTIIFRYNVKGQVPVYENPPSYDDDGNVTIDNGSSPGVVSALIHDPRSVLELDFEGIDGATTWAETAQSLTPVLNNGCEIDTAYKYSGDSSLQVIKDEIDDGTFSYTIPNIDDDFEFEFHFLYGSSVIPSIHFALSKGALLDESTTPPFILVNITGLGSAQLDIVAYDKNGAEIGWSTSPYIHSDSFETFKFRLVGRNLFVQHIKDTENFNVIWQATIDAPMTGLDTFTVINSTAVYIGTLICLPIWVDGVTIKNGVSFRDVIEVTSTEAITVSDNSNVEAGDTITISKNGPYAAYYTTDLCTGGTATASEYGEGGEPSYAFDDSELTDWYTDEPLTAPCWLKYDFGTAKTISRYTLITDPYGTPLEWTIEGSNDDSNWDTLDSKTITEVLETRQTYDFTNTTAYRYYRISILDTENDYADIYDFEMMEYIPAVSGEVLAIYTFVDIPTGAPNEILIGSTAALTAANIASAITNTYGAVFTATASSGVVSIIDHTTGDIVKTTTASGLTASASTQVINYNSSLAAATVPSFTSSGTVADLGAFGENYGMGTISPFVGSGSCSQTDFVIGNAFLPAFMGSGYSFIMGYNDNSTDAQKISLLLYGHDWMENFAPMVAVAGDPDDMALVIVQFVANWITYASDLSVWGVSDYWNDPMATIYFGQDDSEGGSFLIASLLLNSAVDASKVRVCIGTIGGVSHAWVMYQRASDGIWVNLDWTKGSAYWVSISSLSELPVAFSDTPTLIATEYIMVDAVTRVVALNDAMFMYDTLKPGWRVTTSDEIGLVDSASHILVILVNDWLALVDSQANNWNGREIVPDGLNLYDIAVGSQVYSDTIDEAIGIADTAVYALTVSILDHLGFAELASAMKTMAETINESAVLTDSADRGFPLAVESLLSAVDVSSAASLFFNSIQESLAITDASTTVNNIGFTVADPIVFIETIASHGHLGNVVYDTLGLNVTVELNGEVWECYVLNTPKFMPSMYSGFNFNSYCVFENRAFGANDLGVYELAGTTDAGSEIHTGVVLSGTDFGIPNQKRFRKGYLGITGNTHVMVFETDNGKREAYNIDAQGMVVASSDLKGKTWKLSIADFETLNSMKLIPIVLTK
jgi:hypothetical protein